MAVLGEGERLRARRRGGACCSPAAGYAEWAVVDARCVPLPKGLSMIEAGIPRDLLHSVVKTCSTGRELKPGEVFPIHGGTSGISVS